MAQQQRYKVLEKIAAGGMAEVFRAESAGLEGFKKTVAIKRVLPHLAEKKEFIGMFLDEARLSAQLNHSNVAQVFDVGVGDNTYFIVMEYVDGSDLKGVMEYRRERGIPFPTEEACLTCVRICEGLAYAHELEDSNGAQLRIIHRDMSPPNVLLTANGEVKIVDFGLAKANTQLEKSEPGIIKGKFSYLSPEAARGEAVDARTDIFAVGIILWEMLAGRRLFLGNSDLETVRMVQKAKVPSLREFNPSVSPELEAVIMKSLTARPEDRWGSAREFGRELNQVLYRIGRAVSSFDLAQLVAPVRDAHIAGRRRKAMEKGSIIGSLIDEALFEFTSIDGGGSGKESSKVANLGSSPLGAGGLDGGGDWAAELGLGGSLAGAVGSDTSGIADKQFEIGNLAALEDDQPRSHLPSYEETPAPASASPAPPEAAAKPPKKASVQPPNMSEDSGGGGNSVVLLVLVVLLVVGGVAGAWFGGVIPH